MTGHQLRFGDTISEWSAVISGGGTYRYLLTRRWAAGPALRWVMLNPSTADAETDDATIRRVTRFARERGYAAAIVANLYALRVTDPAELARHPEPLGPENPTTLAALAFDARAESAPVVVAWGANGAGPWSQSVVANELTGARLLCLGVTKEGQPRHPLYVRADQPLIPYPGAAS